MKAENARLYANLPVSCAPKVTAEIDVDAIRYNYRVLRDHIRESKKDCRACCVVKADAYGHSAEICVPALLAEGCDFFCVSSSAEALAVREICSREGKHPDILILGYSVPSDVPALIAGDIIQACFSYGYARELSAAAAGGRLRVHIKLDTGMNRIGFPAHSESEISQTVSDAVKTSELGGIRIEGAFAHFARADETGDDGVARTRKQAERFGIATDAIVAAGVPLPMRHTCNSAGAIGYPEYYYDACRLGISLYGADPSGDVGFGVRPVMTLKTVVSFVHSLKKGESVSYGGTYTASRDMKIATLPAGYADGFIRAYTGAKVIITPADGRPACECRIVGRICMDQCMADVDGFDVREGDSVTLIGAPGQIEDLAARARTINYECFCGISARVIRVPKEK